MFILRIPKLLSEGNPPEVCVSIIVETISIENHKKYFKKWLKMLRIHIICISWFIE